MKNEMEHLTLKAVLCPHSWTPSERAVFETLEYSAKVRKWWDERAREKPGLTRAKLRRTARILRGRKP